ncbi:MAG: hypothetical protein COX57_06765 [Alphaproteobacteria bacterium CG_4_10_14_0_2_um_filter_63_37]|nr:MAG: hypothetical protein AUJ55_11570 [Proteobacteria bacterium CG1_02_64_396]PJA24787.1 MAG: hypothetical protein COX57_06765 [Alphaproteobacteria bacterium CG_4_10_14_0_2_um_filter_63_37]
MYGSILSHRKFLHLKRALLLTLLMVLMASALSPPQGLSGSTVAGYILGGTALLLILFMVWFGVRKRRIVPGEISLSSWLSSHIYLSIPLATAATLHAGLHLDADLHGLTFALLWLTLLSGVVGLAIYLRIPERINRNREGDSREEMVMQLAEVERACMETAIALPDTVAAAVAHSSHALAVHRSLWRKVVRPEKGCPTVQAIRTIECQSHEGRIDPTLLHNLLTLMNRKLELLRRIRTDVRDHLLLKLWLLIHVPLSMGLIGALTLHVVSVFYFY